MQKEEKEGCLQHLQKEGKESKEERTVRKKKGNLGDGETQEVDLSLLGNQEELKQRRSSKKARKDSNKVEEKVK